MTARTYELRLIALENFAIANGDHELLFGLDKRPFLAAKIQTYMRKFFQLFLDFFLISAQGTSALGDGDLIARKKLHNARKRERCSRNSHV